MTFFTDTSPSSLLVKHTRWTDAIAQTLHDT